jgi:hypothetical protein
LSFVLPCVWEETKQQKQSRANHHAFMLQKQLPNSE